MKYIQEQFAKLTFQEISQNGVAAEMEIPAGIILSRPLQLF